MERFVQIKEIAASCASALLAMTVVFVRQGADKKSMKRKNDGV